MRPKNHFYSMLALLILFLGASRAAADDESGWRLKLGAAALQPISGGGFDPSLGGGLAVEYRASRRLGLELSATTAELESRAEVGFSVTRKIITVSRFETTPILARLNWHLTPERKADVYLGPVAGWVRYGDVKIRFEGDIELLDFLPSEDIGTEDGFAWGVHAGLDLPVGDGRWFFTSGLTYLRAEVDSSMGGIKLFDLDPLIGHLGFGFRF